SARTSGCRRAHLVTGFRLHDKVPGETKKGIPGLSEGLARPRSSVFLSGSGGLQAAQAAVLPGVPCQGDVFHALGEAVPPVRYLENRADDAIATCAKPQRQQTPHERPLFHAMKRCNLVSGPGTRV